MSRPREESCPSDTLVNEAIGEVTVRRAPRLDLALPEGFELVEMQQPLEQCSAFERNGAPQSSSTPRLPGADIWHSRQPSDTGSFKTVLTHDTEGRVAQVMRPTRLSDIVSNSSCYDTTRDSPPRSRRGSSPVREHEPYQRPVISATSQDIQIGLNTRRSSFSASESEGAADSFWDDTVSETYITSNVDRSAYRRRNLSNEKVAAIADDAEETDPWGFPSPLPEAHLSRGSGFDHYQDRRRHQKQAAASAWTDQTPPSWPRTTLRYAAKTLAVLSVLLPVVFLGVAIAIAAANGQPVTSSWATMLQVAGIFSTVWLFILAFVMGQALISWMTVRSERCRIQHNQRQYVTKQPFDRTHIEAMGVLLFLSLTIAPLGSKALESVIRVGAATQLSTEVGVQYVDHTGQNQLWSKNPNTTLPTTTRAEMIQTVGETYARSLVLDTGNSNPSGGTSMPVESQMVLRSRSVSNDSQKAERSTTANSPQNNSSGRAQGTTTSQIAAVMTTSYFEFMCADWDLTIRNFGDYDTSMSYSTSQTLGMSMAARVDDTGFPTGNVSIASLNKIVQHGTMALEDRWEYSTIQCSWTQLFYNIPTQCDWNNHTSVSNCVQNGDSQLLLNSGSLSGTHLVDFASDFVVSGNVPTTRRIATTTERFIQNGGPLQLGSLNLQSNGTGLLNLSASVTPDDFAKRFGHLFNTWVALGYCPQCSSEIVVGNGSGIPAPLQQQYRRTVSTLTHAAPPLLSVSWGWEVVIIVIALVLLVKGILSIGYEYGWSAVPFCCCVGRRESRKPEIDIDLMRMLLSPAHMQVPGDRYPMPRRPVGKTMIPDARRSLRDRISAKLPSMSGADLALPMQGARLSHQSTPPSAGAAAEEPTVTCSGGNKVSRLASTDFFARRYSTIAQNQWPPSRRRSASEDPSNRKPKGTETRMATVVPIRSMKRPTMPLSNRHSLFPDKQLPPLPRGGESPVDGKGMSKMPSVRYSYVSPSGCGLSPLQQQQKQNPAPAPIPASASAPVGSPDRPGMGSQNSSWIYDEYMSNKL